MEGENREKKVFNRRLNVAKKADKIFVETNDYFSCGLAIDWSLPVIVDVAMLSHSFKEINIFIPIDLLFKPLRLSWKYLVKVRHFNIFQ